MHKLYNSTIVTFKLITVLELGIYPYNSGFPRMVLMTFRSTFDLYPAYYKIRALYTLMAP
jgi:hypothetical protein